MPLQYQYILAVGTAVVLAMLAAAQLVGPVNLGLPSDASAWFGIASAGLGVLASFLPRIIPKNSSPIVITVPAPPISAS